MEKDYPGQETFAPFFDELLDAFLNPRTFGGLLAFG
jgi:hypothetical protein